MARVNNPYQLAHALIDCAAVLDRYGADGSDETVAEARDIAGRLRCGVLLARTEVLARPRGSVGQAVP